MGEELTTDSVAYLKVRGFAINAMVTTTDVPQQTVFVAAYMFDLSIYFPKFSLVAFFWWLIPDAFRSLRIGVYLSTAYVATTFIATLLMDTLIAGTISNNW
jgi:hypothetical protein